MAITKQNLQQLYAEYYRETQAEENKYADVRDLASAETPSRFLTPSKLGGKKRITLTYGRLGVKVQDLVAAYARMGINVEIDEGTISFAPEDLRKLIAHSKKRRKRFDDSVQGMPYAQMLRASAPKDKERAKDVKPATFFGRKGNILFFQVQGKSKPHYRVRIRLEGWRDATTNPKNMTVPALVMAKQLLAGRISIDCQCGRHQFWYRYLACIGNYAIEPPAERDYPKIRNPTLTGCCCKHVLRVLNDFKGTRVQFLVAKQVENARKNPGTVGTQPMRILGLKDLSVARAKRMSRDAKAAFDQYKREAEKIKKGMTPRKSSAKTSTSGAPTINKKLLKTIRDVLTMARATGMDAKPILAQIAKANGLTRKQMDAIVQEQNI